MKNRLDVRDNSGITLIALITTIIILLILAGVATYSGIKAIESTKYTKFVAELKIMQTYVNDWYEKNKDGKNVLEGKGISKVTASDIQAMTALENVNNIESSEYGDFYVIDNNAKEKLGVEGVSQTVLVNLNLRKVVSYLGLNYNNTFYWTLDELNEFYNVEYNDKNTATVDFDIAQEYIGNGKAKISISNIRFDGYNNIWQVKYKVGNGNWNTSNDLNFLVTDSGHYTVILYNEGISGTNEIDVLTAPEMWKATTKSDPSWYNYGGAKVNEPKLIGKMTPIKYDGDLTGETNLWANATTMDQSMWVWIPRYAYKITSGYHTNAENGGTIEIAFLKGTSNTEFWDTSHNGEAITANPSEVTYTETEINGVTEQVQDQWLVHPAFTSNPENGGWDTELTGIWFAKFETTNTKGTSSNPILDVKPGAQSLGHLQIGTQFTLAKSSTFGESSALTINSHMVKNSEWGSVAYLAQSIYGATAKVENNSYLINSTFCTGGTTTQSDIYTTNKKQSTTHNATGIYDMNGGITENVATYRVDSTSTYTELINDENTATALSTKYKTVYPTSRLSTETIKGDAIWETSTTLTGRNTWYTGYTSYIQASNGFLHRGGTNGANGAGTFMYSYNTGGSADYMRFSFMSCILK